MTADSRSRRLLVSVSLALGLALLAIAFLLGRESARTPATETVEAEESFAPSADAQPAMPDVEARRWPKWADLEPLEDVHAREAEAPVVNIEERRFEATGPSEPETRQVPPSPGEAVRKEHGVSEYFLQMDLIRSEAGAGDPNAFAMDLIKAAMGNSMTGFDQLIADARRMEAEAKGVTPPPSCESYHRANLEALVESREFLEEMKVAISGRDLEALAAIAQKARALQAKAETLQVMRDRLDSAAAP